MTDQMTYDVAIVGYGPVGVTAANLLGQMGLNVVVVERDPNIYARARAISTDEEVVRIWQQIGLADRLNADMQPGCGANFVDADGVPFVKLLPVSRGNGHPPQQFIYQPALEKVLREGVDRFPNVSVLLEHECLRVVQRDDSVELMLADLTVDEFRRIRASYVIAADGGSSAIRGQLGIGFGGRTFAERWIVIDTKVLKEWPGHDRLRFHCNPAPADRRLPHSAGSPPLGVPGARRRGRARPAHRGRDLEGAAPAGNHPKTTSRSSASPATATMSGSPTGGGSAGSSWPATPPTRCRRGSARACAPACATWPTCAGSSARCCPDRCPSPCSTPTRPSGCRTSRR